LGGCYAVAAGRIDPDDNVALPRIKLGFKESRCDFIVKPALLGNDAIKI